MKAWLQITQHQPWTWMLKSYLLSAEVLDLVVTCKFLVGRESETEVLPK